MGCGADPAFARAGGRADRAWLQRWGREPPRDRPRGAIARSLDRTGNYGNIRQCQATTAHSTPPTRPPRSTLPNPAAPASSPRRPLAAALPRSGAGAALRWPNRRRRYKGAGGGHMSLPAVALLDNPATPATIGCGKRPDLRTSRWCSRHQNTIADCSHRCCRPAPAGWEPSIRMSIRCSDGCNLRCCTAPRRGPARPMRGGSTSKRRAPSAKTRCEANTTSSFFGRPRSADNPRSASAMVRYRSRSVPRRRVRFLSDSSR
jgi:hypothetical protein